MLFLRCQGTPESTAMKLFCLFVFVYVVFTCVVFGCVPEPESDSTTQELCNQGWDCPNFPANLSGDTTYNARTYAHNYGVVYHPDGMHCTYGPVVSSCAVHVHLTSGVAVDVACAQLNTGGGFNCTFDIVSE